MSIHHQDDRVTLHHGDCLDVLRSLPDASVDSVVTDPPYGLEFMGKDWDAPWKTGNGFRRADNPADAERANVFGRQSKRGPEYVAGVGFQQWCEQWAAECLRVLRPGGHLLAFGGTRTWHRLACAVEDAGFEVRDSLCWVYGSGFPKSHNVRKALGDSACQCEKVELEHGSEAGKRAVEQEPGTHMPRVRSGVSPLPDEAEGRPAADVQPAVSREARCGQAGGHSVAGSSGLDRVVDGVVPDEDERRSEPGLEGWGDLPPREGELCGSALRAMPTGVPGDGEGGRLHHGAPSSDGSASGPLSAAVGSGESHQPRPAGQPAGELGAVPLERGSQEGRGRALCGRCGKPDVTGLGTALKPGFEPVVVARKPLVGTVAGNVLTHGTGALNIDGCRIETSETLGRAKGGWGNAAVGATDYGNFNSIGVTVEGGRWPANVILDEDMAGVLDEQSGTSLSQGGSRGAGGQHGAYSPIPAQPDVTPGYGDRGGASRFFYVAKAPKRERPVVNGVAHPTVKPLALMRWLVRLVTPPGGTVLEPFAGSGTTVEACLVEGFQCIAIEKGDEYLPLILARIQRQAAPLPEAAELVHATDPETAIVEQITGQLDIFGEGVA